MTEAQRQYQLTNEVLQVRDQLEIIASGQITRGRCLKGEIYPGKRKLTLKDAMEIAKHAAIRLNKAVNQFDRPEDAC